MVTNMYMAPGTDVTLLPSTVQYSVPSVAETPYGTESGSKLIVCGEGFSCEKSINQIFPFEVQYNRFSELSTASPVTLLTACVTSVLCFPFVSILLMNGPSA